MTIISPALADANNGNWRTAQRWARFLGRGFEVRIRSSLAREDVSPPDCLIALHARRSADAITQCAERYPQRPRVLVLTGTDLYRDLEHDPTARRSLDLATDVVVLQDAALDLIEQCHRPKCRVIYQSAPPLTRGKPRARTFDIVMVGHMRAEKDPLTPMRAVQRLPAASPVRLLQIGEALGDEYARAARALHDRDWPTVQRYRWLGGRPHAEARQQIRRARALVIPSVMEGGANVIVEAVTSGVPVLASRISGNVGMLGQDYDGYFTVGDDRALADLFERISSDRDFLARLQQQCARRAPLFSPAREQAEVNRLVSGALAARGDPPGQHAPRATDGAGRTPMDLQEQR